MSVKIAPGSTRCNLVDFCNSFVLLPTYPYCPPGLIWCGLTKQDFVLKIQVILLGRVLFQCRL
jgi:hypothetical protein